MLAVFHIRGGNIFYMTFLKSWVADVLYSFGQSAYICITGSSCRTVLESTLKQIWFPQTEFLELNTFLIPAVRTWQKAMNYGPVPNETLNVHFQSCGCAMATAAHVCLLSPQVRRVSHS